MNTINRETFEAWLFAQPLEREFNYMSCSNCVVSSFIKETTSYRNPSCGGSYFRLKKEEDIFEPIPFEDWLNNLLFRARLDEGYTNTISIKLLQKIYKELFPTSDLEPRGEQLSKQLELVAEPLS